MSLGHRTAPVRSISTLLATAVIASLLAVLPVTFTSPAASADEPSPVPLSVALTSDFPIFTTTQQPRVTATVTGDMSGKYLNIWNLTTGYNAGYCPIAANTCDVGGLFYTGGPQQFRAFVTDSPQNTVPTSSIAESNVVTQQRAPWSITLKQNRAVTNSDQSATLTATANQEVVGNVFHIVIYDVTNNYAVARCTTGSTCEATVTLYNGPTRQYVAKIEYNDQTDVQATSNLIDVTRRAWSVTLTQDKTHFTTEETVRLTATANQIPVGNVYYVYIYDLTAGHSVAYCSTTQVCTADVQFYFGGPHEYEARVAFNDGSDIQAVSNTVTAIRVPWTVSMTTTVSGSTRILTATANQNSVGNNWTVEFYNLTTDTPAHTNCFTGNTCTIYVEPIDGVYPEYMAQVARWRGYNVATEDVQATSLGYQQDTGRADPDNSLTATSDPSANNPQCAAADPINCATGEYYDNVADLAVPGRLPLTFTRSYSSTNTADGLLGRGWRSILTMRLLNPGSPIAVRVRQENGAETAFRVGGGGSTTPLASNVQAALTRNPDDTWTYTRRDDTIFTFGADGLLTAQTDRAGETITFFRNTAGRVVQMQSDAGTFDFAYTGDRLASVQGPGPMSVAYDYNSNGDLVSVTDGEGNAATYTYGTAGGAEGRIASMTDPEGNTTTNTYDVHGRVTTQTDPLGHDHTFVYSNAPDTAGTTSTTLTDQAGRVTRFTYDNGWLVAKTFNPGGGTSNPPRTWTFINGAEGLPIQTTDPTGATSFANFDTQGRPLTITNPLGHQTSYTYDSDGNVLTTTSARGHTVTNTYNALGNLTSATVPLEADPNGDTAVTNYTYGDSNHPGDLTKITDPRGGETLFTYDAAGRLTSTVNPTGDTETRTYNDRGLLDSLTGPRGNTPGASQATKDVHTGTWTYNNVGRTLAATTPSSGTVTYSYDDNSRVIGSTDQANNIASNVFDAAGRVTSTTDRRGKTTTYTYDHSGKVLSVTDPTGNKTTYTYNPYGELATATTPKGNVAGATQATHDEHTTTYTYDAAGRVTATATPDPNGGTITTQVAYDAAGRAITSTDPLGRTTNTGYDTDGNVTTVTDALNEAATFTYDPAGRLLAATDQRDHTTTYGYDATGNTLAVTNALGDKTTYTYDAAGRLATAVDPRGNEPAAIAADYRTTYTYDAAGNLTVVTDPLGAETTLGYDTANRPTTVTDPNGNTTTTMYNTRGWATSVTNPDGGTVAYAHNANGNVTGYTNPLGGTTAYTYDDTGRVINVVDPKNRTWSTDYDPNSNAVSRTSPRGTTTNTYDALGRLTAVDYDDATPDTSWAYNKNSLPTAMSDGTGTSLYDYDTLNRLDAVRHDATHAAAAASNPVFTYGYDPTGNLATSDGPNGVLTYTYDEANRPIVMTRGAGANPAATTYTYDPAGLLTKKTLPNGTSTDYAHDTAGQVTDLTHTSPTGVLADRTYGYDPAGNVNMLTTVRTTANGTPVTTNRAWTYDDNNRLTAECATTAPAACGDTTILGMPNTPTRRWTYDQAGNITTAVEPGLTFLGLPTSKTTTYTQDNAGQTTGSSTNAGGNNPTAWTYDGNGNLTSDGTNVYTYDLANRLKSATTAPTSPGATPPSTTYTYDGNNNRATRATTNGGVTTTSSQVWDINNSIPTLATETTGANQQTYTYNPDGTPNQQHHTSPSTTADWYYLTDWQGTVTDVTSTNGTRAVSYDYNPYGSPRGPPLPDAGTTPNTQPFQYTGQYRDPTTGLYNLRARQYNPTTGAFTTPDPLGGTQDAYAGSGLYTYVSGNPLLGTDPTGLCWNGFGAVCDGYLAYENAVGGFINDNAPAAVSGTLDGLGGLMYGVGDAIAHPVTTAKTIAATCASGQESWNNAVGPFHIPNVGAAGCAWELTAQPIVNGFAAAYMAFDQGCTRNAFSNLSAAITNGALLGRATTAPLRSGAGGGVPTAPTRPPAAPLREVTPAQAAAAQAAHAADPKSRYQRPGGATTQKQRNSVQNQPCVDCGTTAPVMRADHKYPLVQQHYLEPDGIDRTRMRSIDEVQPQCPGCSNSQGGQLRMWSITMRDLLGL